MPDATQASQGHRFGAFEVDVRAGELRKHGIRIKLQEQPFQVLVLLLERPGEVVTREELRQKLWPADTFVDFDHGLNSAINKLREALSDSADTPRYIETLPRRGYRFVAPVEATSGASARVQIPTSVLGAHPEEETKAPRLRRWSLGAIAAVGLLIVSGLAYLGTHGTRSHSVSAAKIKLAVLPFDNLSKDPEQEYFSDGMTDEMIAQLGSLQPERLGVIARGSVMRYKNTQETLPQVARELGVDYFLEGSVLHSGDRVRITAGLIQAADQTQLWSRTYERDLKDILAAQSDVASDIARQIELKLSPAQRQMLAAARPVNPEAYEAYLKGKYFERDGDWQRAGEYYERAVHKDPHFALAYASLSIADALLAGQPLAPNEIMPKAKAAALRAIELDNNLGEAYASLGFVELYYDWDWPGAQREYDRARQLNPTYLMIRAPYGHFLAAQGKADASLREIHEAEALDPVNIGTRCAEGRLLYYARRYDEAIQAFDKVFEFEPAAQARGKCTWVGLVYIQKRAYGEAIEELHKADVPNPRSTLGFAALAAAYYLSGNKKEALERLNRLLALKRQRFVSSYDLSVFYALIGDKEHAFERLQEALEERGGLLVYLQVDSAFDSLRGDPRFEKIIRQVGIPQ